MGFQIIKPGFKFGTFNQFTDGAGPTPPTFPALSDRIWDYDSRYVTGTTGNVSSMTDQSDNAIPMSIFNSAGPPQILEAYFNDIQGVEAPGTSAFNLDSNQHWDPAAPFSAFVVAKGEQSAPPYYVLQNALGPTSAETYGLFFFPSGGETHCFIFNGTTNPEAVHFSMGSAYLSPFAISFSYNGLGFSDTDNFEVRLNGVEQVLTYEATVSGGLNEQNFINGGSSSSYSIVWARNTTWGVALTSQQLDDLANYSSEVYGVGDPVVFSPLSINPNIWYDANSVSAAGTDVSGFTDKSGHGIDANFSGGTGILIPNAINGVQPAVRFPAVPVAYIGGFNDTTKRIDKDIPFCSWGVVSAANWYAVDGGAGYHQFWQLNDGPTTCGLLFVLQDPSLWPDGYSEYLVYVGDGIADYIGGDGLKDCYDQYFSYIINYHGGGDFSDVTKWDIHLNNIEDTVLPSPAYEDVLPNIPNLVTTGVEDSASNTMSEFGFKQGMYLAGDNLAGMKTYLTTKYGALPCAI